METAADLLTILLAACFTVAGNAKVRKKSLTRDELKKIGVGPGLARLIGALEPAAAYGLIMGCLVGWLAVPPAIGLVMLMAGAIVHHARAGHYTESGFRKTALLPIFLLLFAAVTLTVRLLTLL